MYSDPYVSLGWLTEDGGRDFVPGTDHASVKPKPLKTGYRSIFLADYMGEIEKADTVRYHPDQRRPTETLEQALARHDIAIGYSSTALVTAALEGLQIICKDKRHILNMDNWKELLPYADWYYARIESGEAWEHLCQSH
jgi:hypothetical protein